MRFGSIVGLAVVAAFGGCSSSTSPGANALVPTFVMPAGLLDSVVRLQVLAFDGASTTCTNPDTAGTVGGETSEAKALVNKDLGTTGCKAGEKFCGDLQIEPDATKTRVFVANAYTADRKAVARGCQSRTVKSGSNQLTIKMFRLIPQAMCAGKPSPYKVVQCAQPGSPTDAVCDAECLSKEQFLSPGSGNAGQTSSLKIKQRASFVWPADADPTVGRFVVFAGDQSQRGGQISMRLLDPDMLPCVGAKCVPDFGGVVQLSSFFVPNDKSGDPGAQNGDTLTQYNPSATYASNKYVVAFEDGTGNTSRIALRTVTTSLFADQPPNQPIGLSPNTGQKRPSMALNASGKLFVAWEANGDIRGRTVDPDTCTPACMLGAEQLVGNGTRPSVAGTANGWVVAWQGGADVKLRALDASGAGGTEVKVNDATHSGNQDTPSVAVLSTGAVGVLWHDSGNGGIFVQRYGAVPALAPVAGDQGKRVNDLTPNDPSDEPALVAGNGAGGAFFAAAWVHRTSGHVHARFLDGAGGFLFNPVDGQTSEFQATRTEPSTSDARQNPAIAVGGSAPYVAIGWEDNSGAGNGATGEKGIFARRFPVPLK